MAAASLSMQAPSATDWGIISIALTPATTTAAIAPDASITGSFANNVSTLTQAATLGALANYFLVGVIGDGTTDKLTGVTYNSVAMTQLLKFYAGSTVNWLYLYGLASPTTGSSQNIVVSASGSCSVLGVVGQSYTNCAASQPNVGVTAAFKSQGIAWSVLVPSVPGCWGISLIRYAVGGAPTNQTCTGCGTTAALRVSQAVGVLNIMDTNGTIPLLQTTALTQNSTQWRLQRADMGRSPEAHLGS